VKNVVMTGIVDLAHTLSVVNQSHFGLILDGDGWIVVLGFGAGSQQEMGQLRKFEVQGRYY